MQIESIDAHLTDCKITHSTAGSGTNALAMSSETERLVDLIV